MARMSRRKVLKAFGRNLIGLLLVGAPSVAIGSSALHAAQRTRSQKVLSKGEWMAQWMNSAATKDIEGDLWLGRFLDEYYFLTKAIAWKPNAKQAEEVQAVAVDVPAGFVTDLTSIPWYLWSTGLRPDGQYTFAAVVHDYLYWTQRRPREVADKILKLGMEDLKVPRHTIYAIYEAVRLRGQSAWDANKKLKLKGERRVLKRYQNVATVYWKDWKNKPDVFAPTDDN